MSNIQKPKAERKKTAAQKPAAKKPTAQYLYHDWAEYLAAMKEFAAQQIFITATTNPDLHEWIPSDPRADVLYVLLSSQGADDVVRAFVSATELTATDNLARPKEFCALMAAQIAPYCDAIELAGFDLRRGRVSAIVARKKRGSDGK